MANSTYYPSTNDGRAPWWQNIITNGTAPLNSLGFATTEISSIMGDAAWGVYAYGSLRKVFEDFTKSVTRYADEILHGTPDGLLPVPPVPPAFPTAPIKNVLSNIEARRELWVQQAKHKAAYNATIGALLGIETPEIPFDPATYQCELYGLSAPNAHTVGGKFRKARGHVDSICLSGRRAGTAAWTLLGSFTATPFSASVPVAGATPEQWEFQARAVRRDVEFGLPSAILEQIIRP